MTEEIIPLQDYVLLEEVKEEFLDSTLVLPDGIDNRELTDKGKIIALGPSVSPKLNVGDTVLYKPYGFEELLISKKKYKVGKEEHIFAILR